MDSDGIDNINDPDIDGDGIMNGADDDSDNDGILDDDDETPYGFQCFWRGSDPMDFGRILKNFQGPGDLQKTF